MAGSSLSAVPGLGRDLRLALAGLALLLGCNAAAVAAGSAGPPAPGCEVPTVPDRITRVAGDTLSLASGLELRLADIRLADGEAVPGPITAWMAGLSGTRVLVASSAPDRWAMRRGRVLLRGTEDGDDAGRIDLAELLVAEGLALVDAGEQDGLCRPDLLSLEAIARAGKLGLWRGPSPPLVAADDTAALAARVGRFTIVEGRVSSLGERPQRTYLNFGRFGTGAFALTIPKRVWASLRRRGVSAELLRGRRVRMRGTVELWRTPVMEVVAPDMLERLDTAPGELR